jgi:ATP-binding cassette, subfamily B, bacterial HlyB/CyaB
MFSQQHLRQYITQILGETLSDKSLDRCLAAIEIVEPQVAKEFWQSKEAKAGIYIVLAGKSRLLDSSENLIATLSVGASFGELTLFAFEEFQPYAARASVNLKLGYLKEEVLAEVSSFDESVRHPIVSPKLATSLTCISSSRGTQSFILFLAAQSGGWLCVSNSISRLPPVGFAPGSIAIG